MAPGLDDNSQQRLAPLDTGVEGLTGISVGDGPPLLYLHGLRSGPDQVPELLRLLAGHYQTLFPTMPGFGPSEAVDGIRTVDDASYLYLEWLDGADFGRPVLVGSSIGAWLALELATKCPAHFEALVLVSPLGVRSGPPDLRFYPDYFALSQAEMDELLWADPARAELDLKALPDDELVAHLRDREAVARYGWDPYFHTPNLLRRLRRLRLPTLIARGKEDGLVGPPVVAVLSEAIADSEVVTIPGAGHFVDIEQPERLVEAVDTFLAAAEPVPAIRSGGGAA
jgi:pimeloyl-ACP methyl ester carboxylesterase